ncbi:hypothetical protein CesoFtcFv8_019312 [Champsocephalus esox]|uniref:Uncharacterized protein n=1 Tax=Champsocephalus esox TaxID=159716 RepID=A0AAN8BJ75_9TELE|nr:hypothetical protein CesoFtcFv8_019312 [Champsocephalus esox]
MSSAERGPVTGRSRQHGANVTSFPPPAPPLTQSHCVTEPGLLSGARKLPACIRAELRAAAWHQLLETLHVFAIRGNKKREWKEEEEEEEEEGWGTWRPDVSAGPVAASGWRSDTTSASQQLRSFQTTSGKSDSELGTVSLSRRSCTGSDSTPRLKGRRSLRWWRSNADEATPPSLTPPPLTWPAHHLAPGGESTSISPEDMSPYVPQSWAAP